MSISTYLPPRVLFAALASTASACVVDAEEPDDLDAAAESDDGAPAVGDELVGELEPQGIDHMGVFWQPAFNNTTPAQNLGSASDRTCFLLGVTGELEAPQYAAYASQASVSVFISGGSWFLQTRAGSGSGLVGYATCVEHTYNRRFLSWVGNNATYGVQENKAFLEDTGLTQCFLSQVKGTVGWTSPSSFTRLRRETIWPYGSEMDAWTLGGDLEYQQNNSSGGGAAAVCIDLLEEIDAFEWSSGGAGASTTVSPVADTTCGMQLLVGNFASDPHGTLDGVKLWISGSNWKAFSSSSKTIGGECWTVLDWF